MKYIKNNKPLIFNNAIILYLTLRNIRQSSEWLEVKEKVDQPLHEASSNYIGQLNSVGDELVKRIRNVRNRQDEVCYILTNI